LVAPPTRHSRREQPKVLAGLVQPKLYIVSTALWGCGGDRPRRALHHVLGLHRDDDTFQSTHVVLFRRGVLPVRPVLVQGLVRCGHRARVEGRWQRGREARQVERGLTPEELRSLVRQTLVRPEIFVVVVVVVEAVLLLLDGRGSDPPILAGASVAMPTASPCPASHVLVLLLLLCFLRGRVRVDAVLV